MDTEQRDFSWRNVITAWIGGIAAAIGLSAVCWGLMSVIQLDDGGAGGRFAITVGLASFIALLMVDMWRTRELESPVTSVIAIAGLHVATIIAMFLALLAIRIGTDINAFAPLSGDFAQQVGPAAATAGIMCAAAVSAAIFALSTNPTPDERAQIAARQQGRSA